MTCKAVFCFKRGRNLTILIKLILNAAVASLQLEKCLKCKPVAVDAIL